MWSDGKKEKWSSFSIMKSALGDSRVERSILWPALPPGAIMRFQPQLTLRAMSGSVAIQQQGSVCQCLWLVFPLENMGMPLLGATDRDHRDVQGLRRPGSIPH